MTLSRYLSLLFDDILWHKMRLLIIQFSDVKLFHNDSFRNVPGSDRVSRFGTA